MSEWEVESWNAPANSSTNFRSGCRFSEMRDLDRALTAGTKKPELPTFGFDRPHDPFLPMVFWKIGVLKIHNGRGVLRTTTTPYIYGIPGRKSYEVLRTCRLFDGRRGASQNCFYCDYDCDTESAIGREAHSAGEAPHGARPRPLWGWDNNNKT